MATKEAIKDQTRHKIMEPKQYNVYILNDDFTPMDFVVEILEDIFHKDSVAADAIMRTAHRGGRALVGKYSYDIAQTKMDAAVSRARNEGYPFRMAIEEA